MTNRLLSLSACVAFVAIAACSSSAFHPPVSGPSNQAAMRIGGLQPDTGPTCPPGYNPPTWPDPANLITDGAFNPAPLPPTYGWKEYSGGIQNIKWRQFVPELPGDGSVDLMGLKYWGAPSPGNECTLDLDGTQHGGILESMIPTVPNQLYRVYFQLSGSVNSKDCPGCHINYLRVSAAGQHKDFSWDTNNNHDVYHGVWALQGWNFTANSNLTTLKFRSRDLRKDHASGAIITEIVVK